MRKRGIAIVGVVIAVGALAAWRWSYRDPFAANLERATRQTAETPIVFTQLTEFPWHSVALFGPYTDASIVRATLGFEWPGYRGYWLEMSDSFSLAVFVEDKQVARVVEIARCSPDFGKQLLAKSMAPSEATFRVDSSNGCPTLLPIVATVAGGKDKHAF